jgi:hypothetical protein
VPGSLLAIPAGDLAQHALAGICFLVQNGYCLTDDVNGRPIPGMERYRGLVDVDDPFPLTFFDQYMLAEITAELACSCFAGVLTLQAMGLGGWMFHGVDRFSMLGASGNPEVPGLGFRYDEDERWSVPNPTAARVCSRRSARRITRTCGRRWRRSASESSAPAGCTTRTPRARGANRP